MKNTGRDKVGPCVMEHGKYGPFSHTSGWRCQPGENITPAFRGLEPFLEKNKIKRGIEQLVLSVSGDLCAFCISSQELTSNCTGFRSKLRAENDVYGPAAPKLRGTPAREPHYAVNIHTDGSDPSAIRPPIGVYIPSVAFSNFSLRFHSLFCSAVVLRSACLRAGTCRRHMWASPAPDSHQVVMHV